MNLQKICIESLASHLKRYVGNSGEIGDSKTFVRELGLEFLACDVSSSKMSYGYSVSCVFEAKATSNESGIRVLSIGLGETEKEAAIDAGHQWAEGILPVIIGYVLEKEVDGVQQLPMIVGVEETGEKYGWKVYVGPVIHRVFSNETSKEIDVGEIEPIQAFRPIFDSIHPFAAHENLMWIEAFSAKYPDGEVDATCRLKNDNWDEGRESLLYWAHSWPDTNGCLLSKRQFVLMQPKLPNELDSKSNLEKALDNEIKKSKQSWWRKVIKPKA